MNIGTSPTTWRLRLAEVFENYWTHKVITWLILISIITLGLETSETAMSQAGMLIYLFNRFVICLFAVEIIARIIAHGVEFFKDPWHIFDFIVVLIAVITFGGYFQIFRVLRVIWFIRTTTMFKETTHLINSLIRAIPHMLSATLLLVGTIYVFAVIGTAEFGNDHPHLFGSVYISMASIIQSVLIEHTWAERLDELYKTSAYAWVYIMPMIVILNFLLLQLVLGIIINAIRHQYEAEQEQVKHSFLSRFISGEKPKAEEPHPMSAETQLILNQLNEIKDQLKSSKK